MGRVFLGGVLGTCGEVLEVTVVGEELGDVGGEVASESEVGGGVGGGADTDSKSWTAKLVSLLILRKGLAERARPEPMMTSKRWGAKWGVGGVGGLQG